MTKKLLGKPMLVVWDDAHGSFGEKSFKKLQKNKPVRTHSVGWFVASNEDGVTLAVDLYEEYPKRAHTTCFIPHGMIVRKKYLT